MTKAEVEQRFYNLDEVAKILGIKVRTARKYVTNGTLKGVKLFSQYRWYVPVEEIDRFLLKESVTGDDNKN